MPNRCNACQAPVHEVVVTCPHCGQPTGAPPSEAPADEARGILEEMRVRDNLEAAQLLGARPMVSDEAVVIEIIAGVVGLVAGVVGSAIDAVTAPDRAGPTLPTAIARERTPVVKPGRIQSEAPEPAPPPSDRPRYLK